VDKSLIIEELKSKVESELLAAKEACDSTAAYKNADDMRQEGKYDTRAIEAGYLAGAQQKRVSELEQELKLLETVEVKEFKADDEIAIGALVELKHRGKVQKYFLSTTAGGSLLNIQNQVVLVISVFSPIGSELIGLGLGDFFELETPKGLKEYEIVSLF
jgi:transcription elongation GreA/GreB family factor